MIWSNTLGVLSACLLMIHVCLSLWMALHSAQLLNTDLQTITDWAAAWLVPFNPLKTLARIISRKQNPVVHPPLFMNGTMIKNTSSHKHLGLTVSNSGIGTNMSNLSQKNPGQG